MGLLSGVLASMGLGGGFVLLLYLIFFGESGQLGAQGQNLLFFIPVIAVSLIFHTKNGLIDKKAALTAGLLGIPFVVLGFFAARQLDSSVLRSAFAVFITIAGLKDLFAKNPNRGGLKENQ